MSTNQYLLHETASGYALFQQYESEVIAQDTEQAQEAISSYENFSKMMKMVAFERFTTAESALEQCNAVASGIPTELLINFLELNLPKAKKKSTYELGVMDASIGKALKENNFSVNHGQHIKELLRGCLMHFPRFAKDLNETDLEKARCGLAHCYSREKMQFDPNRQDKPILNVSAILDGLDKNINTFAMRVKEWYAWHFPELTKIVNDNITYCKIARVVRIKDAFDFEGRKAELAEACGSEEVAEEVIKALKTSMGQDIVEMDMANIDNFASQVIALAQMRQAHGEYLKQKMDIVAPNLGALIGETVGARLISHAGSLTNLAKYPASTVQILGAEKALFRALKTKGNTPKYGLLYNSSFIGRAQQKNKGRISRYLANKCSIASRVDCFSTFSTKTYGEKMRDQVEDRLSFLTDGKAPRKNLDVMQEAEAAVSEEKKLQAKANKSNKSKKRKMEAEDVIEAEKEEPAKKKKKKEKKTEEVAAPVVEEAAAPVDAEKKKKKKKSKKEE